jgi:hypothetical protein
MLQHGQGERAGLDAGEIDGGVTEAGLDDGSTDLLPRRLGDCPNQIGKRQLDPGHVPVVAYPQVGEA